MGLASAGSPSSRGPLPSVVVDGRDARIELTPHGAHLLEWIPAGGRPVLFVSPNTNYTPGKAIRGGVPLVFPWFGPKAGDASAPQHGFARVREWRVDEAGVDQQGSASVVCSLMDDERTRALWPHAFAVRFAVRAGRTLELALDVGNTGTSPFTFEAAFHSYFAVSDVRAIAVEGLANTEFVERYGPPGRQRQDSTPIRFPGEIDRTYRDTAAACVIDDPTWRRRIRISKTGSRTTVVWNPGAAKGRAMADLGDPSWKDFVCVETVCAGADAITLGPGESHTLGATITVEQDAGNR